jgi:predicted MPP superfamily phosphohydrolase
MAIVTRRRFLLSSIAALAGGYGYARLLEPSWLEINHVELTLPKLPDAFANFTIAQLSDLHFGPLVPLDFIESAVDEVLAMNADLIVITGDIVTRLSEGEPDMIVQSLSRLQAPLGVHAVLGNHDWWMGFDVVQRALRRAGVNVLMNQNFALTRGGQSLYIMGVDDVWCAQHDLVKALNGIPANGAVIALVHEPDYADVVAHYANVILQLSGHAHGGQVRVPFYGADWCPPHGRKYQNGLYQINDLALYTNRGVGMVAWQVRFACRPEITKFTLTPGD